MLIKIGDACEHIEDTNKEIVEKYTHALLASMGKWDAIAVKYREESAS